MEEKTQFEKELESLINKHSQEKWSNTPDLILANYLKNCLDNFNFATKARDKFHNIKLNDFYTDKNIELS